MKVSDYIVEYLIEKGITDVFGYPGGMVTHLMDSFAKYEGRIKAHVTYHEQGAAFAACGYAQTSGLPGVAYATSGPGATNLITGICNAYFDSIPAVFITGQVNTFESKGHLNVRQRGFQETDIVSMVNNVTKFAAYVETPERIRYYLDKAFLEACSGRKGPVLLDIPMNVFRGEIDKDSLIGYDNIKNNVSDIVFIKKALEKALSKSERPVLLIGNGVKISGCCDLIAKAAENICIPVVTSMIAFDVLTDSNRNFGFVGAYGHREANFIVAKSDLVISVGSRLDVRQVGAKRENFAPDATLLRFDIDSGEMENKIRKNETQMVVDIPTVLTAMIELTYKKDFSRWLSVCFEIKNTLKEYDERLPNTIMRRLSHNIPDNVIITTDVGQNQVWTAQSFEVKTKQQVIFSGGHGAMGYSLPASIGAYYGSGKKPVISINGDGGFQMNIQELQYIAREKIPIKIIVINNNALGMIRHFQEMYFDKLYTQTTMGRGYSVPSFVNIAKAYGIKSVRIEQAEEIDNISELTDDEPLLVEILILEDTYVFPKLEFGKPNQNQEPLLDRDLYDRLMEL